MPSSRTAPSARPHKLLISYSTEGWLVRDETFRVDLVVKNIGDAEFVGGKFKSVRLELTDLTSTKLEHPMISRLDPQKEAKFSFNFQPQNDGLGWIAVEIEADDERPVEYYQSPTFFHIEPEWRNTVYISSREDMQVIGLLSKIVTLLENGNQTKA